MYSRVLQRKSSLTVSLAVWVIVLLTLPGGNGQAAEYAVDQGSNMYSITAGLVSAGGDLYEDSEGHSSLTILIMPGYTHFFKHNFGFGGDLLILHSKQGDAGTSTLGLGPKVMYFFGGEDEKAYPFIGAGFYYVRNTDDYGKYDYTSSGTRFKFGGGASIMVSPHLGILMEASYNLDNLKGEDADKSVSGNMLIVSVGLVGFSF